MKTVSRYQTTQMYGAVALLCLLLSGITPGLGDDTKSQSDAVIRKIDEAQTLREGKLKGFKVTEHYILKNSHFDDAAELTASVSSSLGVGRVVQVTRRTGPNFLQKRVLDRILSEEEALSRGPVQDHAFTSANYSMDVLGTENIEGMACYVIDLHPKTHSTHLLDGRAWVNTQNLLLIKIEGKPASSPSFWTGKPMIEREYMIINGLSFPRHSRATSKGLFTGRSELTIDYRDYSFSMKH